MKHVAISGFFFFRTEINPASSRSSTRAGYQSEQREESILLLFVVSYSSSGGDDYGLKLCPHAKRDDVSVPIVAGAFARGKSSFPSAIYERSFKIKKKESSSARKNVEICMYKNYGGIKNNIFASASLSACSFVQPLKTLS